MAASGRTKELIWLKTLYLVTTHLNSFPVLMVDNEAAIRLANSPKFHIRIRSRHYIVEE